MDVTAVNSTQLKRRERTKMGLWMALIYIVVLAAEIVAAYFVIYKEGAFMGDAISRTANAYYVLFLNPPKLASIGFVWNPLPSLIQLLIIPFSVFWKPLVTVGFAGSITTALFAAANASLLFRYFRQTGLSLPLTLLIVALYTFNPFIFYYGFNGMSETFFFTCMLICTANFALWTDDRKSGRLVAVALMLAVGFLTRYEVFALMLGIGLAMLIGIYLIPDRKSPFRPKPWKMKWDYSVATGTMIFLPVLYTILIWMFLNWTIMDDPLYFLRSAYSNESQSAVALSDGFKDTVKNPFSALFYVLTRMLPFLPPFAVITGERIATKRLMKPDYLILVLLIGAISGFHWVMLMAGKSFGWLRFYCFALPFCIAWMPYEFTQLQGRIRRWTAALLCASLLVSSGLMLVYFQDNDLGREEYATLYSEDDNLINQQMEAADEINRKYRESTILVDAFMSYSVIVGVDNPKNLITNLADDIFDAAVENPQRQLIDYVVIPTNLKEKDDPSQGIGGVGALDAVNNKHPELFQYGADWADLVFSRLTHRIYKVLHWDEHTAELIGVVNSQYGDATLLFDNSTTGMLHKSLHHPENAITLMSESFHDAVESPQGMGVDYIIVPRTAVDSSGSTDDINRVYPELMADGVDWAMRVYENELYRIYEVLYPEGKEAAALEAKEEKAEEEAASYGTVTVTLPKTYIREDANPTATIVQDTVQGVSFPVVSKPDDNWYGILLGDGSTGFIRANAVAYNEREE